ncbi:polyphenol oxidase [Marchantia polymorpha subsp. ruderalis]|uniref:Tyrosinase copper-binding domain-containing protein n=2 Tax=Marchantia polymorpha TaxID=3197 RepID=A0AAF6B2Z6_MARPO|nr:hypothetical protein MARPO_0149s0028 [Marchantia polymorpha]BBN06380.1 hypothetical protein Mp_3g20620 [Marchantia polymorpha subsp. ruderalis]|eukprot:PTQ29035.1 hypothetical protein MARPO_0149s0028 [Marchantia polymorpha]
MQLREGFMMVLSTRLPLIVQCLLSLFVTTSLSAPIIITRETFKTCRRGAFNGVPADCCPPKFIQGPIVDFSPKYNPSKPLRVRKALQCLTGKELTIYTEKLQRGYALMRALPDDDPRSFKRQNEIHCAYGTGPFIQNASANLTLDIHLNWFFLPWHRMFIYFHEKILQTLLKDPNFTLHFWNFDSSVTLSTSERPGCFKAGHFFPPMYLDPSKSTFEPNRTYRAFEPSRPVDLSFDATQWNPLGGVPPVFPNYTLEEQVWRNGATMYKSVVSSSNASSFIGKPFRAGDVQIVDPTIAAGNSEKWPHISVHMWIGGLMYLAQTSPRDPIFYHLHANVERIWDLWHKLGDGRADPSDPDWLDAEFLIWDEKKVMRRVKVRNVLDIKTLGDTFENVNDASWICFQNSTSTTPSNCSSTKTSMYQSRLRDSCLFRGTE